MNATQKAAWEKSENARVSALSNEELATEIAQNKASERVYRGDGGHMSHGNKGYMTRIANGYARRAARCQAVLSARRA